MAEASEKELARMDTTGSSDDSRTASAGRGDVSVDKFAKRPWRLYPIDCGALGTLYEINDARRFTVFAGVRQPLADYIVRCVNAHDAMKAALQAIRADASAYQWHEVVEAALALAEGR